MIREAVYFNDYNNKEPNQDNNSRILYLNEANNKWKTYTFNGKQVPRVSDLLKECIGKDYLLRWAANLGENYKRESAHTLYIGTLVHEMIEYFLFFGGYKEIDFRSYNVKVKTEKAYSNFLSWYNDKIEKGFKISPISIEKQTTNPWFGGTIDCIMRLEYNGISRNYIVDFKTSKKISIEYILQTYAYYWSENWNYNFNGDISVCKLDGLGIIRIDKEKDTYEDLFLDFNNPENYYFLSDIDYALGSIINWYYHMQIINNDLSNMKRKGVRQEGFVNGKQFN